MTSLCEKLSVPEVRLHELWIPFSGILTAVERIETIPKSTAMYNSQNTQTAKPEKAIFLCGKRSRCNKNRAVLFCLELDRNRHAGGDLMKQIHFLKDIKK